MDGFPILSLITFLPLFGAILLLFLRGNEEVIALRSKQITLLISGLTFALVLAMMFNFDPHYVDPISPGFQFVEKLVWFKTLGISYHMGIDGISLFFIVLTAFLTPVAILFSWDSVKMRVREFMIAFLILEFMLVGTFCALDAVLFYIFFEGGLIPMFIIIGIWGGADRIYASYKFVLYTLFGSVLMLLAFLAMIMKAGTADIPTLMDTQFPYDMQLWLWVGLFASFAIKIPMWPVHTWLPAAHVEAPTAGSVLLAGILMKMGGYGFLRFMVPMIPDATAHFTPLIFFLSLVAFIYTALVALVQHDMKKMIAYFSVAHMGIVTLGIFSLTPQGMQGAIFQMISHGLVSGALFMAVGVVYDRLHTRDIDAYGNLAKNMPFYSAVFIILMLGSVALPGTSGFIGEVLVLVGAFQVAPFVTTIAAFGALLLGATYMLRLARKLVFGPMEHEDAARMPDLNLREKICFVPIVMVVIWLGVAPSYFLDRTAPSVDRLIEHYHAKLDEEHMTDTAILHKADAVKDAAPQVMVPEETKPEAVSGE